MEEQIENRVKKSPLVSFDLEDIVDKTTDRKTIDLKENLFQGLVLREKDFRLFVKEHDWDQYNDCYVNLTCSTDAIIPNWAYMLLVSKLSSKAKLIVQGNNSDLEKEILRLKLDEIDYDQFQNAKIVIKGCSELSHPEFAFTEITNKMMPYVSSIMYGEPCSTVPIYKAAKK
ncbi:DUF2480 family protein [Marivirga salinae]|uniref:DUF2480 family protein n=1 Tax=Marivirga salinarum TaxID=3059078 RepID=A0AA51NDV1_9BACT|nr:DUF2480 family protein [Marivirga sp. BDSF4-3]WMN11861.1 DUF2480 family protein [Marivirga sp. BDSF4-3]